VGLQLAEQRTQHLLDAYEKEEDKEREIYGKIHVLEIEKIGSEIGDDQDRQPHQNFQLKFVSRTFA